MRLGPLAVLTLALAPRALAATAEFPLWERHDTPASMSSADGYHYAEIHQAGDLERLYLDGRVVARGPTGTLCYNKCPLALSADGLVVAHQLRITEPRRSGYSAAVNGKPFGGVFNEIRSVQISPKAGNAVYTVRTGDDDWAVLSAAGLSPTFAEMPGRAAVGESGLLYLAKWKGATWLFRDHKPVDSRFYAGVYANPSLSRVATVYHANNHRMAAEANGKLLGEWAQIDSEGAALDYQGRLVFSARANPSSRSYDAVVVEGVALAAAAPRHPAGAPSGRVYWLQEENGDTAVYRDGVRLGSWPIPAVEGWISFSPTGAHWAALTAAGRFANLVVDGKVVAEFLPEPVGPTRLVFDNESELHYLGARSAAEKVALVCVALGEAAIERSACVGRAERLAPRASAKP